MKKWEYKVVYGRDATFDQFLNEAGEQGWEAYHLEIYKEKAADMYDNYVDTDMYDIYLKREIRD